MLIANDDLSAPQIFFPRIDHGVVNEGLACHEKMFSYPKETTLVGKIVLLNITMPNYYALREEAFL